MLKFRPVDGLMALFGYQKGRPPRTRAGPDDLTPNIMGMGQAIFNWFQKETQMPIDRLQRYREFDAVDTNDILASALDLYAEDACRHDVATGRIVWVSAKDKEIEAIGNQTLETCRIEENAFEDVRAMIKYGDYFKSILQTLNEQDIPVAVAGVRPVQPYFVSRVEDDLGRLKGFNLGIDAATQDKIPDLGPSPVQGELQPWEMIHFKLPGRDVFTIYGTSILYPARRVFRMLNMMEEALVIYRIRRSPDRLKWKVDTGGAPPDETWEILNMFRQSLMKKMMIDPETGEVKEEMNPWTLDDDIYIPTSEDSLTDCELFKGAGPVGNILDVEYFRKRLFACLRIPPDYMGYEDASGTLNSHTPLADQDVRYSKTIKRIQKAFMTGVTTLVQIDMILRGIDIKNPKNEFRVCMQPVSYLEEIQQAEVAKIRAGIVSELISLGKELAYNEDLWVDYVSKLSGFPEEMTRVMVNLEAETTPERAAKVQKLIEAMIKAEQSGSWMSSRVSKPSFKVPSSDDLVQLLLEKKERRLLPEEQEREEESLDDEQEHDDEKGKIQ